MSSTSPSPTVSSPTNTPTNTSNTGGGSTINFFGFLIAVAAVMIVLLVCGLGSRRRFVARRRAMLADLQLGPWTYPMPVPQTEPKYWEPSLVSSHGGDWNTIMPLSVSVLHDEAETQESRPVPAEPPFNTFSLFPLSSWVPFLQADTAPSRSSGKRPESSRGHHTVQPPADLAVQVEVLISFPSAPRSTSPEDNETDEQRLPEYYIGSTRALWEGGRV